MGLSCGTSSQQREGFLQSLGRRRGEKQSRGLEILQRTSKKEIHKISFGGYTFWEKSSGKVRARVSRSIPRATRGHVLEGFLMKKTTTSSRWHSFISATFTTFDIFFWMKSTKLRTFKREWLVVGNTLHASYSTTALERPWSLNTLLHRSSLFSIFLISSSTSSSLLNLGRPLTFVPPGPPCTQIFLVTLPSPILSKCPQPPRFDAFDVSTL